MKNKRRKMTETDPFTYRRRNGTNCEPLRAPKKQIPIGSFMV